MKGVRILLGNDGYYRRFIRNFIRLQYPCVAEVFFMISVSRNLSSLKKFIDVSILIAPNWELPFGIMRDASDTVIDAVFGK